MGKAPYMEISVSFYMALVGSSTSAGVADFHSTASDLSLLGSMAVFYFFQKAKIMCQLAPFATKLGKEVTKYLKKDIVQFY